MVGADGTRAAVMVGIMAAVAILRMVPILLMGMAPHTAGTLADHQPMADMLHMQGMVEGGMEVVRTEDTATGLKLLPRHHTARSRLRRKDRGMGMASGKVTTAASMGDGEGTNKKEAMAGTGITAHIRRKVVRKVVRRAPMPRLPVRRVLLPAIRAHMVQLPALRLPVLRAANGITGRDRDRDIRRDLDQHRDRARDTRRDPDRHRVRARHRGRRRAVEVAGMISVVQAVRPASGTPVPVIRRRGALLLLATVCACVFPCAGARLRGRIPSVLLRLTRAFTHTHSILQALRVGRGTPQVRKRKEGGNKVDRQARMLQPLHNSKTHISILGRKVVVLHLLLVVVLPRGTILVAGRLRAVEVAAGAVVGAGAARPVSVKGTGNARAAVRWFLHQRLIALDAVLPSLLVSWLCLVCR